MQITRTTEVIDREQTKAKKNADRRSFKNLPKNVKTSQYYATISFLRFPMVWRFLHKSCARRPCIRRIRFSTRFRQPYVESLPAYRRRGDP